MFLRSTAHFTFLHNPLEESIQFAYEWIICTIISQRPLDGSCPTVHKLLGDYFVQKAFVGNLPRGLCPGDLSPFVVSQAYLSS